MISLRYLHKNNAKLRKNMQKLAIKIHPAADFCFFCASGTRERTRERQRGPGWHEYCTPYTDSVIVVCIRV